MGLLRSPWARGSGGQHGCWRRPPPGIPWGGGIRGWAQHWPTGGRRRRPGRCHPTAAASGHGCATPHVAATVGQPCQPGGQGAGLPSATCLPAVRFVQGKQRDSASCVGCRAQGAGAALPSPCLWAARPFFFETSSLQGWAGADALPPYCWARSPNTAWTRRPEPRQGQEERKRKGKEESPGGCALACAPLTANT